MKKFIVLSLVIFFCGKNYGQWTLVPCPTTVNLNSVHFPNQNVGYAVGATGTIIKTNDLGNNWILNANSGGYTLNSIHCLNQDSCLASSISFPHLKTQNGSSWSSINTLSYHDLTSVNYISRKFIYFVGSAFSTFCGNNSSQNFGYGVYSKDGGLTWDVSYYCMNPKFTSVQFIDTLIGFVSGVKIKNVYSTTEGSVLKTINGGQTWTVLPGTKGLNWNSVCFINKDLGYVAGDDGKIRKTTDGGTTWTQQYTYVGTNFKSIYFATPDTGCAVGNNGTILETTDGGVNWWQIPSGTLNNLNSVYFTNRNTGYIVGDGGVILKKVVPPVAIKENNKTQTEFSIYPNPVKNLLSIQHPNSEIAVSVYDLTGRNVLNDNLNTSQHEIDLSQLEKGVYFVKIQSEQGISTKKIIKE